MNELSKIVLAGLLGSLLTLLVIRGIDSALPRPVVHYYAPEPDDLTPEGKAKIKAEEEKAKAEKAVKQRAYAQRCADARGSVIATHNDGLVACAMPVGTMPDVVWLEGRP